MGGFLGGGGGGHFTTDISMLFKIHVPVQHLCMITGNSNQQELKMNSDFKRNAHLFVHKLLFFCC